MISVSGWRRFITYATIDVLLLVAASTAIAAPAAHPPPSAGPVLPALALLGVGLFGFPLRQRG